MASPFSPSPSGDPDFRHFDRGSMELPNKSILTAHVRHAIKSGELDHGEFANWLTKPWTALTFFEGRVSNRDEFEADWRPDVPKRTLVPIDILNTLREWSTEAERGDAERHAWEAANGARKNAAEAAVQSIHGAVSETIAMHESTGKELTMSKGLNAVENVLRGTKEYLWDDFWEHPEMSAGLVIMTALVYPMIKDNPIWTYTKWGVATTIGGAFLKRKFNVQPTERLAEVAERLGRQDIADGIRTTVQTMRDVAFGKEGEGTLNHYFYDKLDLHRDAERSAFNHLLQKKPKEFLAWYNEAKQWTLDRRPGRATSVRVPTAVANEARAMTRMQNVPDAVKAMNTEQKVDILLEASDKVLAHIAAMNPTLLVTPPGTTNEQKGLALLQKKYIDGSYFNLLWDRFEEANPIPTTLSPAIQDHLKRIRDEREKFYIGMAGAVQRGSDVIQFIDILLIENDADAITKFKGTGLTPEEIKKWWEWVLKEAKDKGAAAMAKAKELYEGGRTYWSTDVFPALKTAWTYDVAGRGSAEDLYKWMFAPDPALGGRSRADIALEKAIDLGKDTIEIAIDNPIVDLLKEAGIMAKDALVMTRDELVEFRKWLEEYRKIGKLLNTFDIDVDRARDMITWNLGSADALPLTGYHYRFTLTFHPIADAANPPPAGSAMPAPTVKIIDLSGSFSAARPAFTNAPLWINVSTSPAIPLHYKYHKVSVELEVQTGAGTTPITRSRMARQVSL